MPSKRSRAFAVTVRLAPGADPAAGLVQAARRVLVAPSVQAAQIVRQAEEEAQPLQAQVGAGEMAAPAAGAGRLDQGVQRVRRRRGASYPGGAGRRLRGAMRRRRELRGASLAECLHQANAKPGDGDNESRKPDGLQP